MSKVIEIPSQRNETQQRYAVGSAWSKNGGSKDAVRSVAGQVGELLDGVIAAICPSG